MGWIEKLFCRKKIEKKDAETVVIEPSIKTESRYVVCGVVFYADTPREACIKYLNRGL